MSNSIDQQFVEYVVKSLVGNPDAVVVERTVDDRGVLLELTVDPEDLGRVIGKRGATAQSLRTLLRALGTKNEARYNLKIVDNGVGAPAKASDDDQSTANEDQQQDTETVEVSAPSDMVAKTRAELDDLDDLDI
ncbi:KH domain-containing protein [Candidatus Saccharibacteria bacterium]|nr:KH domain-containing protein [Candidatus Saccharibacteria bacterium]